MITTHSDTNGMIKNVQKTFRSKKGNITPPLPNQPWFRIKRKFCEFFLFLLKIMFFVVITNQSIFAQSQEWNNLNPFGQPPGNYLYGLDFINNQRGWAVGEWGIIMKTTNSGQSWQVLQNHTIDYNLFDVNFINEDEGWAVGDFGLILHTINGGEIWHEQISDTIVPLNDVFFISDSIGWIVGFNGVILHTKNKGSIWETQASPTQHELRAVTFVNQDTGWICGTYTTLLKTTDGGEHWIEQDSLVEWSLVDIDFVDPLNGWLLPGYNPEKGIFRTENGGDNWLSYPTDGIQYALDALSDMECWIVGRDGLIKHTTNGGENWQLHEFVTSKYLYDVCFIDNQTGWTVGQKGSIINTADGGESWSIQSLRSEEHNFLSGTFISEQEGWLVEGYPGRLCYTSDGANNWEVKIDTTDMWFTEIEFTNPLNGWFFAMSLSEESFLWRTTNGGNYWETKQIPYMQDLLFLNDTTGFGGGNSIYITYDGGENWQTADIQAEPYYFISDIFFIDRQHGWAVGASGQVTDGGIILKTTDGGVSWQTNRDPASVDARAVFFTDTLNGYVVGSNPPFFNSVIMSTQSGGESWSVLYISDITGGTWINDVIFVDDNTGWCVGDYGFIWYTENGGNNWQRIPSGTHADLNRIKFIDNSRIGYIFGDDNTLLKLERSIISIEDKHSNTIYSYRLYQNYPNPFNSSTTIKFELPKRSYVSLKIFNILGEEIANLISGYRSSGSYAVSWNAQEFSSGIYFYRLETENSSSIKKMVYIK